jgi:hypothetical protein
MAPQLGYVRSLDLLLETYGERPPAMSWYLATTFLRQAPRPFRYSDDDGPERVERMIDTAEEAASL